MKFSTPHKIHINTNIYEQTHVGKDCRFKIPILKHGQTFVIDYAAILTNQGTETISRSFCLFISLRCFHQVFASHRLDIFTFFSIQDIVLFSRIHDNKRLNSAACDRFANCLHLTSRTSSLPTVILRISMHFFNSSAKVGFLLLQTAHWIKTNGFSASTSKPSIRAACCTGRSSSNFTLNEMWVKGNLGICLIPMGTVNSSQHLVSLTSCIYIAILYSLYSWWFSTFWWPMISLLSLWLFPCAASNLGPGPLMVVFFSKATWERIAGPK